MDNVKHNILYHQKKFKNRAIRAFWENARFVGTALIFTWPHWDKRTTMGPFQRPTGAIWASQKAPGWLNMSYNHVLCPWEMFKGHFGSCRYIFGHKGTFWVMKAYHWSIILGRKGPLGVPPVTKSAVFLNIVQKGGGHFHVQKFWSKFCMILKAFWQHKIDIKRLFKGRNVSNWG